MPPKKSATASRKRAAPTGDYESDGGFIEDAAKSKKIKQSSSKANVNSGVQKDDDGNEYWELSRTRRVQLSEFKKNMMVNIREFYEKDDKMLPGKKGISLSIDQFKAVIEALPEIEASLKGKGIDLPRPQYGGKFEAPEPELEDEEEEPETVEGDDAEEEDEEEAPKPSKPSKLDWFKHKANHEATSDEDN